MPTIDVTAKWWEMDLAGRFGQAVAARRKAVGLTAAALSTAAADLGYPISRQTIAKIENNNRLGKVDVAELIVLAAALDVSPLQLLYPDLVDGPVPLLPNAAVLSLEAIDWFMGENVVLTGDAQEGPSMVARTRAYFAGTKPLRLAARIGKLRRHIVALADAPSLKMGPGTDTFRTAVADLAAAQDEARREGLIVEPGFDRIGEAGG